MSIQCLHWVVLGTNLGWVLGGKVLSRRYSVYMTTRGGNIYCSIFFSWDNWETRGTPWHGGLRTNLELDFKDPILFWLFYFFPFYFFISCIFCLYCAVLLLTWCGVSVFNKMPTYIFTVYYEWRYGQICLILCRHAVWELSLFREQWNINYRD